jgi:hypothetical protein
MGSCLDRPFAIQHDPADDPVKAIRLAAPGNDGPAENHGGEARGGVVAEWLHPVGRVDTRQGYGVTLVGAILNRYRIAIGNIDDATGIPDAVRRCALGERSQFHLT